MANLPENQFFRILLLAASVVFVIAYGVLGARLLEPRFESPLFVKQVSWNAFGNASDNGIDLEEAMRLGQRGSYRVFAELQHLNDTFKIIGHFREPISIAIDVDKKSRLLVTSEFVQVTLDIASTPGQLSKAVFKSWLLQRAPTLSQLQLDTITDVLVTLTEETEPALASLSGDRLDFPAPANWLSFASSFGSYCRSKWSSIELAPLCRSELTRVQSDGPVSTLGFRPLLASIVSAVLSTSSVVDRWSTLQSWLNDIQNKSDKKLFDADIRIAQPAIDLDQIRDQIRTQVSLLLPTHLNSEQAVKLQKLLGLARLLPAQPVLSDFMIRTDAQNEKTEDILLALKMRPNRNMTATGILQTDRGWLLLPGAATVSNPDVQSEIGIWSACAAPTLHDVNQSFPRARRFAFLQQCAKDVHAGLDFAFFAGGDIRTFAQRNPTIPFVVLNLQPTRWALAHGFLMDRMNVSQMTHEFASPYWGLQTAELDQDSHAYKVLGAVEAIAWFRHAHANDVKLKTSGGSTL